MTPRTFLILAAVTVVVAGAAAVSVVNQERYRSADVGGRFLASFVDGINRVQRLEVVLKERSMTFERRDADRWVLLLESDGYPARTERIQKAVLGLAELRTFEAKTARAEWHAKLDLRAPGDEGSRGKRVRALDATGGVLADIIVGRTRYNMPGTTRDGVYVRRSGETQAWLALGELDIGSGPGDWLEHRITDVAEETVREARFRHPDGQVVALSKTRPEDDRFALADIPEGKKLKYDNDPNTMAAVLENLDLEDARKATAVAFAPDNTVEARFSTFDGLVVTVWMTEVDGAPWVRLAAEAGDESAGPAAAAINQRTAGWAYRIPSYKAARLKKRREDMLVDRSSGS